MGKNLSNMDWESATDPDAKVARMKNGSTRLGYKPEHAVDPDTGVIVAAPVHPADQGDTNTLEPTLDAAVQNLASVGLAPTCKHPYDLVPDKGYHSRGILRQLDGDVRKSRISEPKPANEFCAGMVTRPPKRLSTPTGPTWGLPSRRTRRTSAAMPLASFGVRHTLAHRERRHRDDAWTRRCRHSLTAA